MAILENSPKNYSALINEVSTGQVKIPQFQRNFVWAIKASAKLIDSILKGYPIGTFIFWRTDEQLRSVRNIGNIELPTQSKGEFVNYVLDGQQRITSFYAAVKGEVIERENGKNEDFNLIYLDLDAEPDADIVVIENQKIEGHTYISLKSLLQGDFIYLAGFVHHGEKIQAYQNIIRGYNFNVINLRDATIDVATEVFTRLNEGGKQLTLFEIMVAKTYDHHSQFDLSEKYEQLAEKLSSVQYTLPSQTVLQVVAMLLAKDVKRKTILGLKKEQIIKIWPEAVDPIEKTVDFFRGYGIPVSRLLPYTALIVPFAYYFHKTKANSPVGETKRMLEDFFWRASLGTRYSSGVEGKLLQDVHKIDKIIKGKLPGYEWSIDISEENLLNSNTTWFSTGRSFVLGILCLYAQQRPKSFQSDQLVTIDNSWLKVSTSKNYHHFFPMAYMKKKFPNRNYWEYNNVLNITIIDGYLNKNQIKAKPPATYMKEYFNENPELAKTMKTHLIGDLDRFGIWENDFDKFIRSRARMVTRELSKRIIDQATGNEYQAENNDGEQEDVGLG